MSRSPAPSGGRFVLAALALTLFVAVGLALLVQSTAARHRRTAERVLSDYAAFAAENLAGRVAQSLAGSVYRDLNQLRQAPAGRPGEKLQASLPQSSFRLPLPAGNLALAAPALSGEQSRWVVDTIRFEAAHVYRPDWYLALVFGAGTNQDVVLAYAVVRDSATRTAVAYGIVYPTERLRGPLDEVTRRLPLLPASLTGGEKVDSIAAVEILGPGGRVLYSGDARYPSTFQGRKTLDPIFGGLATRVTLRPTVADRLIIGGLPRSRLPLLLGLLGLTALLVVSATLQLRREQQLIRLRTDFVASVSHELRTPLAQLRMFTETLLLGRIRSETERRRSLEILDQEARRLSHLVDNLLYVARGEAVPRPPNPEMLELAPALRELAESFAPLAASAGSTVELALAEGLQARVDRGALRQILLNLLDNAVKYGPRGGRITLSLEPNGGGARIRVDDQGPGIPRADRDRIWQRFARLDRDVDSEVAGSGIGLAIVRDLVEANGGSCGVETAPGGGARFEVRLP